MCLTHEPEPLRIFAAQLFSKGRGALRPHAPRFPDHLTLLPCTLNPPLFRRTPYALLPTLITLRPVPYALRLAPEWIPRGTILYFAREGVLY